MKVWQILEYVGWCQPISIVKNDNVVYEGGCGDRPFTWENHELDMFSNDCIEAVNDTLVLRIEG